jgi:hypothetical protein
MAKKITAIIMLTIALAMLAGCDQGSTNPEEQTTQTYSGTQTLGITYREGMPYSPVTKGDRVDVGVELKNYGAEDITGGKITVEGITSIAVGTQALSIEGKKTSGRAYGGPEYMTFTNIPIDGDQSIIVTACYPYKTKLIKNICYDPTIGTETRTEVCTFQPSVSISGGQGAPVAITNVQIDRRDMGKKAKLTLTIENGGGGSLRSPAAATADCDGRIPGPNDINRVRIDKIMFSGKTGNCNPTVGQNAVLESGRTIVSCEFSDMGTTASQRQLNVELSYGYISQSEIKQIQVET